MSLLLHSESLRCFMPLLIVDTDLSVDMWERGEKEAGGIREVSRAPLRALGWLQADVLKCFGWIMWQELPWLKRQLPWVLSRWRGKCTDWGGVCQYVHRWAVKAESSKGSTWQSRWWAGSGTDYSFQSLWKARLWETDTVADSTQDLVILFLW